MRRLFFFLLFFTVILSSCVNEVSVKKDFPRELKGLISGPVNGVWNNHPYSSKIKGWSETMQSWGTALYYPNSSMIIDLGKVPYEFDLGGGRAEVKSVIEFIPGVYKIVLHYSSDEGIITINLIDSKTMWIDNDNAFAIKFFGTGGKDHLRYKISGPLE